MSKVKIDNFINLPYELNSIIGNAFWYRDTIGRSSTETFFLEGISNGGNAYLKVINNERDSMKKEKNILDWLNGKLLVPQVIYYGVFDGKEFMLISEIKGLNAAHDFYVSQPSTTVTLLAKSLRLLHQVDIVCCSFDSRLDIKIHQAKERVDCGLVDENDFEIKYRGKSSKQLYNMLLEKKPSTEDLFVTHGDYCMANIILLDNKLSGFIDLGTVGIGDRYQDIALAIRSFKHNFKTDKLNDLFYKKYGIEDVDYSKIEFYILLDEFF